MKNYRKDQTVKHKDEEIKRIKRTNQALKHFAKPNSKQRRESQTSQSQPSAQETQQFEKNQEDLVFRICKQIAYEIDRQQSIATLQSEISEDEKQLLTLIGEVAGYKIKKERLDLKAEEEELIQEQMEEQLSLSVLVKDLDETIKSLEERISDRQRSDLLRESV